MIAEEWERVLGEIPAALYRNLCVDLSAHSTYEGTELLPGMNPVDAACSRIRASLLKKFTVVGNRIAESAARLKFLAVNENCKGWVLRVDTLQTWDEELIGCFRNAVDNFLHPNGKPLLDSYGDILHLGGVGPGAGLGSVGGDFYTKLFSSQLSTTSMHLYGKYRAYVWLFPEWGNAELIRHAAFGDPAIVRGNRLSFVPKNTDISRTICTEPVLNMFYQLGLGRILNARLKDRFGIDLDRQQFKNRELARLGSLEDQYVTIDLESASDSISCRMLEEFMPGWFYAILNDLRSPVTNDAGVVRELHMISTMGNGYTFSLQTMLFACVVEAAFKMAGVKPRYPRGVDIGNFGINGDDIICPTAVSRYVVRLLDLLGFTVNHSKSFFEGPFRESCGGDYYLGRNIRGVYVKRLDTKHDFYVAINQLNRWSARTLIALPRTIQWLLSGQPYVEVPRWEDDSAGIKVPYSLLKERWICRDTGSLLYRPYVAKTQRFRIGENKVLTRRGQRSRIYNPSGLLISFLQQSINSCSISYRQKPVLYTRKLRVAPYWDAMPEVTSIADAYDWTWWETMVHVNFTEA